MGMGENMDSTVNTELLLLLPLYSGKSFRFLFECLHGHYNFELDKG